MTHTFKKGDKIECINAENANNLVEGKIYEVFAMDESHLRVVDDCGVIRGYYIRRFKPAQQPFPLANTKINVQKYAEENGISLEQAHKEIQPWLFEQGYLWCEAVCVSFTNGRHLYVEENNTLAYGNNNQFFSEDDGKEITLSRKVTVELTPSFVEVEAPAVEYVELGGKRYVKKELEEALSKIKAVEE